MNDRPASWLLDLPEELIQLCALELLKGTPDLNAVQHLSFANRHLCASMQTAAFWSQLCHPEVAGSIFSSAGKSMTALRQIANEQRFSLCWSVQSTAEDVIVRCRYGLQRLNGRTSHSR